MNEDLTTEQKLETALDVIKNITNNLNAGGAIDDQTKDPTLLFRYAFQLRVIQTRLNSLRELIETP